MKNGSFMRSLEKSQGNVEGTATRTPNEIRTLRSPRRENRICNLLAANVYILLIGAGNSSSTNNIVSIQYSFVRYFPLKDIHRLILNVLQPYHRYERNCNNWSIIFTNVHNVRNVEQKENFMMICFPRNIINAIENIVSHWWWSIRTAYTGSPHVKGTVKNKVHWQETRAPTVLSSNHRSKCSYGNRSIS